MALPNIYDWNRIRACLNKLQQDFPGLLENIVLIGGGACWFYREALRQWNDPDFPLPDWTEAEESLWLNCVHFIGAEWFVIQIQS